MKSIPDIFSFNGEAYFRDKESAAVAEAAAFTSSVIATGGGAILREENLKALKENGRIYFIDRPLSALTPTDDRPLSSDKAAIEKRYKERYPIYLSSADVRIDADTDAVTVAKTIAEEFKR